MPDDMFCFFRKGETPLPEDALGIGWIVTLVLLIIFVINLFVRDSAKIVKKVFNIIICVISSISLLLVAIFGIYVAAIYSGNDLIASLTTALVALFTVFAAGGLTLTLSTTILKMRKRKDN